MAKKARKRLEEDAGPVFEFPTFDEAGFVWKEYEMTTATAIVGVFALLIGFATWALSAAGIPWFVPLTLGILGIAGSAFATMRLRPGARAYTKGDWAGLIALEFFGWLALWFVLLNLAPGPL